MIQSRLVLYVFSGICFFGVHLTGSSGKAGIKTGILAGKADAISLCYNFISPIKGSLGLALEVEIWKQALVFICKILEAEGSLIRFYGTVRYLDKQSENYWKGPPRKNTSEVCLERCCVFGDGLWQVSRHSLQDLCMNFVSFAFERDNEGEVWQ